MRRYLALLREPHVLALLLSSTLSRLPIGVNGLAAVLYLVEERGSFAVAGAVAGAIALGAGLGAPVVGRTVDRIGARRVLPPIAFMHAGMLGALVLAQEAGAHGIALVAIGFGVGITTPPTTAVLRALWPDLVGGDLRRTAYALDTVLIEVVFIVGPVATGIIASFTSASLALFISAFGAIVGTTSFIAALPAGAALAGANTSGGGRWGALATPGIRTLIFTTFPVGVAVGATEVVLPAFSDAHGDSAKAGLLLALWSLGSLAGGIAYGAAPHATSVDRIHLAVTVALPFTLLPLALAGSVLAMALLVLPAGLCIAPLIATRNELVGRVAPAGSATEAYTWPVTSFVSGIALGAAVAGSVIEAYDWRTATVLAGAIGLLGSAIGFARRRTLLEPA